MKEKTISNIGRVRACGFRDLRPILSIEDSFEVSVCDIKPADVIKPVDSLFSSIFTVNPVTNLPDGDLALFMNENTSPEVRMFIEQNLMRDLGDSLLSATVDLSDDDIVRYSRAHNESVSEYRQRIYDILINDLKSDFESKQNVSG